MSNCIKELYDYDLVKKCRVCQNISLKSNYYENTNYKDGLQLNVNCVIDYTKNYYVDNKDRLLNQQKFYNEENRDKN